MKTQSLLRAILFLIPGLLFTGCRVTMKNLTPERIPQNPSGIYTFTMAAKIPVKRNIAGDTLKAYITIGGDTHEMHKSSVEKHIYKIDYKIPLDFSEAKYYFNVDYGLYSDRDYVVHSKNSPLFTTRLVNRYVIQLNAQRGPVGVEIGVIGRGFSPSDTIIFGNAEVPINYHSGNSLSFIVPSIASGISYNVTMRTDQGYLPIGNFLVDTSYITVSPKGLRMSPGDRETLEFSIEFNAPPGGFLIPVTTNIPNSIIMPEVIIPEGSQSVKVPIEGGDTGMGKLYIDALGFNSVELPIIIY